MNKFVDRNGKNLNKKKLKVLDVVRNVNNGEIDQLYVEEYRSDTVELESEGTMLNAFNMNNIITKLVLEVIDNLDKYYVYDDAENLCLLTQITDSIYLPTEGKRGSSITWSLNSGDEVEIYPNGYLKVYNHVVDRKIVLIAQLTKGEFSTTKYIEVIVKAYNPTFRANVEFDANNLELDSYVSENFNLLTTGECGSKISWEVVEGTGISIEENVAVVTMTRDEQTVKLKATVQYECEILTKEFIVVVKGKQTDFTPKTVDLTWVQTFGEFNQSNFEISSDNGIALYAEIENPINDCINTSLDNNSTSNIIVSLEETIDLNGLSDYPPSVFTFYVHLYLDSDKDVKIGTLKCNVTYIFLSVTPDD